MGGGNPWAGEAVLVVDGRRYVCKLTLGALAELEASMEADSLVALVERFETGGFRSRDVLVLLLAGLRGGGWSGTGADLARTEIKGGPVEAMRVAALLLGRAFALPVV
jgi:hypothetical protein